MITILKSVASYTTSGTRKYLLQFLLKHGNRPFSRKRLLKSFLLENGGKDLSWWPYTYGFESENNRLHNTTVGFYLPTAGVYTKHYHPPGRDENNASPIANKSFGTPNMLQKQPCICSANIQYYTRSIYTLEAMSKREGWWNISLIANLR